MGRPRKKERRNWPEGFLERRKPSGVYYYFRDRDSGQEIPLGKDKTAALAGVRLVQIRRAPDPVQAVVARIEQPTATVRQHFDWFVANRFALKKIAESTRAVQLGRINKLCRLLGPSLAMSSITSGLVNEALDQLSAGDRNRYRALAIEVFRSAVARSVIPINPAEQTEKAVVVPDRQRDRLTLEQYQALYAVAEPWMQRAMELARLSLIRPGDLCALLRADWSDGRLRLRVSKTEGRMLIRPHAALKKAITACWTHAVEDCQHLLCKPINNRAQGGREHAAALSRHILHDEFERLKMRAGIETSATFYEIKSRGVDDYLALGWTMQRIQSLIGHESEDMTAQYADGHGERWDEVDLSGR